MSSIAVSCIVFACVFGGAILGMSIRAILPQPHLSSESKDVGDQVLRFRNVVGCSNPTQSTVFIYSENIEPIIAVAIENGRIRQAMRVDI